MRVRSRLSRRAGRRRGHLGRHHRRRLLASEVGIGRDPAQPVRVSAQECGQVGCSTTGEGDQVGRRRRQRVQLDAGLGQHHQDALGPARGIVWIRRTFGDLTHEVGGDDHVIVLLKPAHVGFWRDHNRAESLSTAR